MHVTYDSLLRLSLRYLTVCSESETEHMIITATEAANHMGVKKSIADDERLAYQTVAKRAAYLNLATKCKKCGGDGSYGMQTSWGNKCFPCRGTGCIVTITAELARTLKKANDEGELAGYWELQKAHKGHGLTWDMMKGR
jgi:hypothetical protein